MLIDAFAQVADRFPAAALWIAGDGPEAEALKAHVQARNLEGRVHLLGRRNDVPAVLAAADVFANASSWEGMSNAVLEGMAAGLPAVVADAPGVTECHEDGVTGLVVRRDARALADGLARLLADADLRARMGAAARERVRTCYSMEANRQRYLDLFDKLTGRTSCAVS
ncbi:glycosyl transferase, group 1 [Caenispirillum salinarum AK4]|uniref:Glycosyl transferase, group 1 n=2 Tax=Caenispirillum TaxID=414051 RepID=K9GMI5_9PROT|nr:glycosyl transferase, group 1 [Caenispirillum salinarum AK4]